PYTIDYGEIDIIVQTVGVHTIIVPQSQLVSGLNTVTLVVRGGDLDFSAVDYVRLTYWRTYTAESDALRFAAAAGQPVTVDGFSRGDIRLIDVTDPSAARELAGTVRGQSGSFRIT